MSPADFNLYSPHRAREVVVRLDGVVHALDAVVDLIQEAAVALVVAVVQVECEIKL